MKKRNPALWLVVVAAVLASLFSTQIAALWIANLFTFDSDVSDAPLLWNATHNHRLSEYHGDGFTGSVSSLLETERVKTPTRTEPNKATTNIRSRPPRPHPHAGARDVDGSWGYVADVTWARRFVEARYRKLQNSTFRHASLDSHLYFRDYRELDSSCQVKPREGKERKAGWRLLTQKVQVNGPDPNPNLEAHDHPAVANKNVGDANGFESVSATRTYPRIMCAVYTYEKREEMSTTVAETWGWKCDGFFAASTRTVHPEFHPNTAATSETESFYVNGLGSVDLPHLGPERYENMWQKTRSILSYMHDNYLEAFDFFFLSGDDTYLIVENLRRTLVSLGDAAWDQPLYLGHWIPYGSRGSYFCGGGPGYVLNRKSLELLVTNVFPTCKADLESPSEDRILGQCLQTIGIVGNHSVDALGAQRFHGMDPHDTCTMKGESGFFGMLYRFWGEHYGFRTGFNLTSSQSVSFHMLRTSRHLKRIHAILYKSCPPNTTIGDILGPPRSSPYLSLPSG